MPHDADITRQVRLYIDGELPADEARAFTERLATNPDLRHRLAFEERLRDHVASIMNADAAPPADLADRLRTALAEADTQSAATADAPASAPADAPPATRPAPKATPTRPRPAVTAPARHERRRRHAAPPRANVFMIAATLALVAAAVLIGIFGPSIDEVNRQGEDLDRVAEAATWASTEHVKCAGDRSISESKLRWHDVDEARRQLAAHLGRPVLVPVGLEMKGYEFVGAGPCEVPGGVVSGHIMFRRAADHPRGPAMVSLFVAPDDGQYAGDLAYGMYPRQWYVSEGDERCTRTILRTTTGSVTYFLVCCDEADLEGVADIVASQLAGVR